MFSELVRSQKRRMELCSVSIPEACRAGERAAWIVGLMKVTNGAERPKFDQMYSFHKFA